jgi:O-antigen ligase
MSTDHFLDRPVIGRMARWAWLLVCVLLPIDGGLVPVPLAITIVLCLVLAIRNRPTIDRTSLWPLFIYYVLHVVGMSWTSDVDFGLFDLQVKLGLLLLPIAAAAVGMGRPDTLRASMLAFTAGTLIAVSLGVHKAWTCFTAEGLSNCFSQSSLSHELHPSYTAWYTCWVIAYWGVQLIGGQVRERWSRMVLPVVLPVILVFTVMLASKSGIIGLGSILLLLIGAALYRLKGRVRILVLSASAVVIALGIWSQAALVSARMAAAWEAVEGAIDADPGIYTSTDGNAMRLVAWLCSVERLQQAPLGAGTGDIKHALMECYEEKNATEAAQRRLNSHSQFLQSAVALGWPGLVVTLLVVLVPLVRGWRERDLLLVCFILLFMVNATVESVLEVQAGVVFFGLFLGLLTSQARTSVAVAPNPVQLPS